MLVMRWKLLAASMLGAVLAYAWTWNEGPTGSETDAAQGRGALQVTPAAVDFGRVRIGDSLEEVLVARNAGDAPLEATLEVDAPFLASRRSLALRPNESREVLIGLQPREAGTFSGSLRFASSAGQPEVAVPLHAVAHVPGRAAVAPLWLRFGAVALGEVVESEIEIRNDGDDALQVSGLGVIEPFALPDVDGSELELAPRAAELVRIEFRPAAAGEQRRTLLLRTSDPEQPTFQIALSGEGVAGTRHPLAEVSLEALDFGEVMVGRVRDLSLQVRNAGSDPLHLTRLAVAAPYSVAQRSREIPPGRAYLVPVSYAPVDHGPSHERLRIFTNDPERSLLEVALHGVGSAVGGGRPVTRAVGGGTLLDDQGNLPPDSPLADPDFRPEPIDPGSIVAIGTYDAEIEAAHVRDVVFDPRTRELRIEGLQLPEIVTAGDQRFSFDPVDVRLEVDANGEVDGDFTTTVHNSLGNPEPATFTLTTGEMTVHTPSGSLPVPGAPLRADGGRALLVGQVAGGFQHHNMEIVLNLVARGAEP